MLLLISVELIDLVRTLLTVLSKEKNRSSLKFFWLLNILFPPLNGKRLFVHVLKSASQSFCEVFRNDAEVVSLLSHSFEVSPSHLRLHFLLSLFHLLLIFFFLCSLDLGLHLSILHRLSLFCSPSLDYSLKEEELDADVLEERRSLLNGDYSSSDPLVLLDLVKKYPGKETLAVNHLTFRVQKGECFGLLGFNGAGQTSLHSFSVRNAFFVSLKGKVHCFV